MTSVTRSISPPYLIFRSNNTAAIHAWNGQNVNEEAQLLASILHILLWINNVWWLRRFQIGVCSFPAFWMMLPFPALARPFTSHADWIGLDHNVVIDQVTVSCACRERLSPS
jgi:hypothetical protein